MDATGFKRIEVREVGDVTIVEFSDQKIEGEFDIQELGKELFQLVESDGARNLLLCFSGVEYMASAFRGKLITLSSKVKAHKGLLKLSSMRSEIREMFAVTQLDRLLDIKDNEEDALAAF